MAGDWVGIRSPLTEDVTWTRPGDNTISGTVEGAEATTERAKKIASYGLGFELPHLLVSRENVAPSLHNTVRRGEARPGEYPSTARHRWTWPGSSTRWRIEAAWTSARGRYGRGGPACCFLRKYSDRVGVNPHFPRRW